MRQLIRFGAVGLVNTLVGLAVIMGLIALGAGDYAANLYGYLVGLALSFVLNRSWTFGVRGAVHWAEVARFLGAVAIAYGLSLAVLTLMRGWGFRESLVGQGAAMITYSGCLLVLSRGFVFPRARAEAGRGKGA
ncbi:GtrA family protein [Novosphingobium album (ex Liu et al. 2023)]|uniref:GtrA family protein n=1 Tax=Novosphingobium album (ex Liu et al. 2023) TaxID=3031130 RepID=A0ABT5WN93_9SPHN|nr:GtrA family protein [Novosphingobium album (ex Liu et al. 2023)]MDE8651510.1 GtrA family protein [Novosphingobium album (ex Liu et al. 2023)]